MPSIREVRRVIDTVTADRHVSLDEWDRQLRPLADATPGRASGTSREVLRLWADNFHSLDGEARHRMRDYLVSRGYAMPLDRPATGSTSAVVRDLARTNVTESDPVFSALVHRTGRKGEAVAVGILDTGFDLFHQGLGYKGWQNKGEIPSNGVDDDRNGKVDDSHGWDFVDWNNDTSHPFGDWHGSHVAGIAAKGTEQVDVIPLRVLEHPYPTQRLVDAMEYAIGHGARVINMSFGLENAEQVEAIRQLILRNPSVLFVLAAGNSNRSLESYDPREFLQAQRLPNAVTVAAADWDGRRAGYSNYSGQLAGLAARGTEVSTAPGGRYESMSGSSMAAPNVVNAAARAMVLDSGLTPESVKRLLALTSDRSDAWSGQVASGGVINTDRAFKLAALTGLVRRGATVADATRTLKLTATDRRQLTPLVSELV